MSALIIFMVSVSLAATAARLLIKLSKLLPLALSLYFGAGAYAAAISFNSTPTLPSGPRIAVALACAVAVAAVLSLPSAISHWLGLRGDFYALFSLAYGYGLWYLLTFQPSSFWKLSELTSDGVSLVAPPDEKLALRLAIGPIAIGALAIALALERRLEDSSLGEGLRWYGDGVVDQRIYGLRVEVRLLMAEVWSATLCGLGGALSTLYIGTSYRFWGEPATLVVIVVASLCSFTSRPVTVILGAIFACAARPVLEGSLPAAVQTAELAVFGLVLYAFALSRSHWGSVAKSSVRRWRRLES